MDKLHPINAFCEFLQKFCNFLYEFKKSTAITLHVMNTESYGKHSSYN